MEFGVAFKVTFSDFCFQQHPSNPCRKAPAPASGVLFAPLFLLLGLPRMRLWEAEVLESRSQTSCPGCFLRTRVPGCHPARLALTCWLWNRARLDLFLARVSANHSGLGSPDRTPCSHPNWGLDFLSAVASGWSVMVEGAQVY